MLCRFSNIQEWHRTGQWTACLDVLDLVWSGIPDFHPLPTLVLSLLPIPCELSPWGHCLSLDAACWFTFSFWALHPLLPHPKPCSGPEVPKHCVPSMVLWDFFPECKHESASKKSIISGITKYPVVPGLCGEHSQIFYFYSSLQLITRTMTQSPERFIMQGRKRGQSLIIHLSIFQ